MSYLKSLTIKKIICEVAGDFNDEANYAIAKVAKLSQQYPLLLKWDIFVKSDSEANFADEKKLIHQLINNNNDLKEQVSPVIISQPPIEENDNKVVIEAWFLTDIDAITYSIKKIDDTRYIVLNDQSEDERIVFAGYSETEFVNSKTNDFIESSKNAFKNLVTILNAEGMNFSDVVRQWNYIGAILYRSQQPEIGLVQNYQLFNDIRQDYYSATDWSNGYPAATGIGMDFGGVSVGIVAAKKIKGALQTFPVDNPLQIAAHAYSKKMLIGDAEQKMTPKFERAKSLFSKNDNSSMTFVSGTAAIRGEESLGDDPTKQTELTMENIVYLISQENIQKFTGRIVNYQDIYGWRIYVKNLTEYQAIKNAFNKFDVSNKIDAIFVIADVCRDELLVEIECVAVN
ncbi:hypothetical protein AAEX28_06215 [Lentisphaerota bacterium WC36G]|nr:hypothetical protein LJT99_09075 [Lentisphaerae bacterium WC36]